MSNLIIIPTYNEVDNLPRLVAEIRRQPGDWHVLVVDDNSPDGTGQAVDALSQQDPAIQCLHRTGKLGLGSAYISGMRLALEQGFTSIGQMDADFSHPPELLPHLSEALQGCDLALGSRYRPGGSVDRDWPAWRKGLSAFGNWYARSILGLPLRDVTGGFRLWRREALLRIPLERIRSNGYGFLVEMLYVAHCLGCSFCEVPFYFADRKAGRSKMSFRIQREAALRVWQMRWEYRDLKYDQSNS